MVKSLKNTLLCIFLSFLFVFLIFTDLANPQSNTKSAGFTIEERNGFTELLSCGFTDSFRKLYPEKKGAYSYWTYFRNARAKNTGW